MEKVLVHELVRTSIVLSQLVHFLVRDMERPLADAAQELIVTPASLDVQDFTPDHLIGSVNV